MARRPFPAGFGGWIKDREVYGYLSSGADVRRLLQIRSLQDLVAV
ncbi:MAG: hypothetical protein ACJ74Y_05740 [Bryobacteraceae bacterium]